MNAAIFTPVRRRWLLISTPVVCRAIVCSLILLNFFSTRHYLTHACPVDLAGDEAQYWDWSRHLDWSYYSKGPLVAYVIRLSCHFLGDTMPAVRLPALLFAAGTTGCTYWLTRALFQSDRLALGATGLGAIVPMYAAGGMLMTIDPPLFFCWAVATCFAARAVFDGSNWAWPAAGIAAGVGVLAKYAMLLWPPIILVFLALDPAGRSKLKTAGPWVMTLVALAFTTPSIVWNARHGWVTFHHVAAQTSSSQSNLFEFIGSQVAAINPPLFVLMVAAVVYAFRGNATDHRPARYLAVIGGSFFAVCLFDSLLTKVQVNWPAPAYFTLLILTAHLIAARWTRCRPWFVAAVIFGLLAGFLMRDLTRLYPAVAWVNRTFPRRPGPDGQPRQRLGYNVDLEYKMRGIADPFAKTIGDELASLPPGSFVLCEDYMDASQLAFYLPGQPKTYFAGSYWTDLAVRRRWTQFDLWPDRQLDRPELIGRDCVYVGTMAYDPLRRSFDSVKRLPDITVHLRGRDVRSWTVWQCHGFKGMHRPPGEGPR